MMSVTLRYVTCVETLSLSLSLLIQIMIPSFNLSEDRVASLRLAARQVIRVGMCSLYVHYSLSLSHVARARLLGLARSRLFLSLSFSLSLVLSCDPSFPS